VFLDYLLWGAGIGLLLVILIRGWLAPMLRNYPVFYSYILFVLGVEFLRAILMSTFGPKSSQYYYAYYWPTYMMSVLQFVVVWTVHSKVFGRPHAVKRLTQFLLIAAILLLPLLWKVMELRGSHIFYRIQIIALFVQMASCVFVCRDLFIEREKIRIGQNLFGILTGTSLMVGSQTINFGAYLLLGTSEHAFWFLIPFMYFLALSVFAFSLWNCDPLRTRMEGSANTEVRLERKWPRP